MNDEKVPELKTDKPYTNVLSILSENLQRMENRICAVEEFVKKVTCLETPEAIRNDVETPKHDIFTDTIIEINSGINDFNLRLDKIINALNSII